MCGTQCGPCQVNAVNLSYLVYVLAVLLTLLDIASMLALSIAVSVILICYLKCLKNVQKSFFVKEACDTTFIVEELIALECCFSLSSDFFGIHNHTHLPSTYQE